MIHMSTFSLFIQDSFDLSACDRITTLLEKPQASQWGPAPLKDHHRSHFRLKKLRPPFVATFFYTCFFRAGSDYHSTSLSSAVISHHFSSEKVRYASLFGSFEVVAPLLFATPPSWFVECEKKQAYTCIYSTDEYAFYLAGSVPVV
jgi:hypothetical protein